MSIILPGLTAKEWGGAQKILNLRYARQNRRTRVHHTKNNHYRKVGYQNEQFH